MLPGRTSLLHQSLHSLAVFSLWERAYSSAFYGRNGTLSYLLAPPPAPLPAIVRVGSICMAGHANKPCRRVAARLHCRTLSLTNASHSSSCTKAASFLGQERVAARGSGNGRHAHPQPGPRCTPHLWQPAGVVIAPNTDVTSAFAVEVADDGLSVTVTADASVGTSGCAPGGPGSEVAFTGATRTSNSCVAGSLQALAPSQVVHVSVVPKAPTP